MSNLTNFANTVNKTYNVIADETQLLAINNLVTIDLNDVKVYLPLASTVSNGAKYTITLNFNQCTIFPSGTDKLINSSVGTSLFGVGSSITFYYCKTDLTWYVLSRTQYKKSISVSFSWDILPFQTLVIQTNNATTLTLPKANGGIVGNQSLNSMTDDIYSIKLSGSATSCIVAVQPGEFMNDILNSTTTIQYSVAPGSGNFRSNGINGWYRV